MKKNMKIGEICKKSMTNREIHVKLIKLNQMKKWLMANKKKAISKKGVFKLKQKEMSETKKLTIGALFICLGILFPYVMGHAVGVPGGVLLPMHIPVIIAGLLLGPKLGLAIGILTPIASSFLTGMPPMWPMLPQMIVELGVFGFIAGYLRRNRQWPIYASLLPAMLVGRIARGVVFALIMWPTTAGFVIENIIGATILGFPGIIIQLLFIPITVMLLEKHLKIVPQKKNQTQVEESIADVEETIEKIKEKTTIDLLIDEAIAEITAKKSSFVLIKDEKIIYRASGRGVKPFMELLATDEGRNMLEGGIVVDKIIGKAAAMLAVFGQVSNVYGIMMSENGKKYLEKSGKLQGYTRCVDVISKKDGNGICPIEKSVLDVEQPEEAYELIKETIASLMKKAQ